MATSFQLFENLTDSGRAEIADAERATRQHAAECCFTAIQAYWEACALANSPSFSLPLPPSGTIGRIARADAHAAQLGRSAAAMPDAAAAFVLSSLYASMLPAAYRSAHGVFYTPPALVDRLLALATESGFDWETGRVLDPACGGGAFIAPVAARMAMHCRQQGLSARATLREITSRIAGIELDPFAGWMSYVFMLRAIREIIKEAGEGVPLPVVNASDALAAPSRAAAEGYDLVVGNPPYGKVTLTRSARARFGSSLYGHANLYGLFTHLALDLVKPDGLIAYVTPTSFLGGQYFKNLRRLMARCAPPGRIDFIADRIGVFSDVLQETLLVVYRKQCEITPRPARKVALHVVKPFDGGLSCEVTQIGSLQRQGEPSGPWIFPRDRSQVPLFRKFSE